jgi:hypothetical protein
VDLRCQTLTLATCRAFNAGRVKRPGWAVTLRQEGSGEAC